jgi:hypothetical protein
MVYMMGILSGATPLDGGCPSNRVRATSGASTSSPDDLGSPAWWERPLYALGAPDRPDYHECPRPRA